MSTSSKLTLIAALLALATLIEGVSLEKKLSNKQLHYKKLTANKLKDSETLETSDSPVEVDSGDMEEVTDLRFLYQCIDQHNKYRRSSEDEPTDESIVLYSSEIEKIARRRAIKLASTGKMSADSSVSKSLAGEGIAENVAFTPVAGNNATSAKYIDCRPIVDLWYTDAYGVEKESVPIETESAQEVKKVTISKKLANNQLRNLIWHKANEIGCAQVSTFNPSNAGVYTVCNYRFTENSF